MPKVKNFKGRRWGEVGLGVIISDSIFFSEEICFEGDSWILCQIFRNFNGLFLIIIVNSINLYLVFDWLFYFYYEYMQDIIENKILKGIKKTI